MRLYLFESAGFCDICLDFDVSLWDDPILTNFREHGFRAALAKPFMMEDREESPWGIEGLNEVRREKQKTM